MVKVKTSELTGAALDWAVAKLYYADRRVELTEGKTGVRVLRDPRYDGAENSHWFIFFASSYWDQGGPIKEKNKINSGYNDAGFPVAWLGHVSDYDVVPMFYGPTELIAAMRCFVASKLGDEVDVPEELTQGE